MYNKNFTGALNKPVKVFSFDNDIGNVEADICIAAASSNDHYEMVKQKLLKRKSYYKSISCNGMPLATFAKKHGNKKFKM